MCFRVLSGLPGTPKDLKNLIDRSTSCGPSGPSGPSGGDSNLMVSLVGKAKHDEIRNERTGFGTKYPENDKYTLDFCFPDLPST